MTLIFVSFCSTINSRNIFECIYKNRLNLDYFISELQFEIYNYLNFVESYHMNLFTATTLTPREYVIKFAHIYLGLKKNMNDEKMKANMNEDNL